MRRRTATCSTDRCRRSPYRRRCRPRWWLASTGFASVKDVAQIGAAIGREFSHELIAAVSSLAPADLDAALERLTASGLISRRGTPPDATYSFKHALVQDAAYATMLKSRRRQLHASIAKVLVERFAALAETPA